MRKNKSMSRELLIALLIIIVNARVILSIPGNGNSTFLPSSDPSHLKIEARNDNDYDNSGISEKSISEISLNVESLLKVKMDDQTSLPSNPIILRQNNLQARNGLQSENLITSTKDSYLDALEYSHAIKDFQAYESHSPEYSKVDYTSGPVYRGEDSNNASSANNNLNHSSQQISETKPKISRISHSGNAYEVPTDSYVLSSLDSSYSGQLQVPFGTDYSIYDSYGGYRLPDKNYKIVPLSSFRPPSYSASNNYPYLAYGTPQQGLGSLQATYSTSHPLPDFFPFSFLPSIDLSWPISLKLDAFTLIKIVLKLIVFKIIIKFIAVVCLLIFIPKLIHKKYQHDADNISHKFTETSNFPVEQMHLLGSLVMRSIDHYKNMNSNETKRENVCTDVACQIRNKLFTFDYTWNDYARLFKAYVVEEQTVRKQSRGNRSKRK